MQFRKLGPVQTLLVMMRSVITQVAGKKIKHGAQVVIRGLKLIIGIETGVMIEGYPCRKQQAQYHRNQKDKQSRYWSVDAQGNNACQS